MKKRVVLDIEELKNLFRIVDGELERLNMKGNPYNPTWKIVENKVNQGGGYCLVKFNGRLYMYHVILWTLHYNENIPEGFEIDHINGNKIDNRIENLRLVTHRTNCQNLQCHRGGALVGSMYDKRNNKYQALIRIGEKRIHLGCFKTVEEANEAYKIACQHIEEYVDNESFRCLVQQEMIS